MIAEDGSTNVYIPVYATASVLDFTDATEPKADNDEELAEYRAQMTGYGKRFADLIATELRRENLYAVIERDKTDGEALVISGEITRCTEGNPTMRMLIGLGAGSSYFDANVRFTANESGELLGQMKVDKNSWALGGGMASGQTVDTYMRAAAKKIASEIIKYRQDQVAGS